MCFDNDADWYAEVVFEEYVEADKDLGCHECGARIRLGEVYTHIFMQQHELCQACDDKNPECEHDYGETYTYRRCGTCSKILKAIETVEESEGCPPHARRPMLEELVEVFSDRRDAKRYAVKAVELYPELEAHQWIASTLAEDEE